MVEVVGGRDGGGRREAGDRAKVRLLDFHAEATSEKLAMGWYLDGRVSAVWGTHKAKPQCGAVNRKL